MSTPQRLKTPTVLDDQLPWYELIDEVPERPEDGMEQDFPIRYVASILDARYESDPSVLVAGPTNIIYDSDRPGSVIAPDCYVVFGVDVQTVRLRRSYRIQEWGPVPSFVMEAASPSTAERDLGVKRDIYARIGVPEYWRLDRGGEYYGEPLVGERLVEGAYQRIELHTEANGDVWSRSEVLGVDFYYRVEDGIGKFLLRDSVTGEWLNNLAEEREARLAEREARLAAEARNRELEEELDRLRQQQRHDMQND